MFQSIFAIILGLIVIVLAINFIQKVKRIKENGVTTEGIVFDTEQSTMNDSTVTNPIIRFTTKKNEWITEKSKVGVIPGMYKKGKKVTVIYQKDNPSNFLINDNITAIVPYIIITIASVITGWGIYTLINI